MKIRLLVPVYVTVEAPGFSKALGDQAVEVIADSHPNPETLAFGEVVRAAARARPVRAKAKAKAKCTPGKGRHLFCDVVCGLPSAT